MAFGLKNLEARAEFILYIRIALNHTRPVWVLGAILDRSRVVITGIGLTSPLGNSLREYRMGLLEGKSAIQFVDVRHMGKWPAGICHFEETRYQKKKAVRRGTRAGSIAIYCSQEALGDSQFVIHDKNKSRVGVYLGITEHGNVETEEEIHQLYQNELDVDLWSHHHNPRTVANNPAGEVTLNLGVTGPHYTLGAACAAGNVGLIHACQMLQLGQVDMALAGGVSESPRTFGIFAAFKSQGALGFHEDPTLASRPLDKLRNGIVISEGGAVYTLERRQDALARGAKIYGEIAGYHINSDATDYVLPSTSRQVDCMALACEMAKMDFNEIDIVNMHATGTPIGDVRECEAVGQLFGLSEKTYINFTKGHIGHAMGAAAALELAGNLSAFEDNLVHGGKYIHQPDQECLLKNLVHGPPTKALVKTILNNSFGMLGINSVLIVKKGEH